jgi:hypothetical protein
MTFDRRLRTRMRRLANEVDPEVEARLERTIRSSRRRNRIRTGGLLALETTLALTVLAVFVVLSVGPHPSVGASPSPVPLRGTWTTTVASTDRAITTNGMNGQWTIVFTAAGVLDVTPPASYLGPRNGYPFQVSGDTFRTDLLSADVCSGLPPGSYRWVIEAERLRFATTNDACAGRAALLTASPWTLATGQ